MIDSLCATIQLGIDNDFAPPITITQIKEKFGTLRFHVRTVSKFGGNEWVRGAIEMAITLSAHIAQDSPS
ncbi:hypothetical protein RA876_19495 (plasmid) [Rhodoferax antarcticus]|nr:hypothetical protein RA876_19495 [Rhodoferax antarcticus]